MYPRFTFLYPTWWVGDWWVGDNTENFTCTVEDRERVVYRSIVVGLYEFIEDYDDVAQTGTVSCDFCFFVCRTAAPHASDLR